MNGLANNLPINQVEFIFIPQTTPKEVPLNFFPFYLQPNKEVGKET